MSKDKRSWLSQIFRGGKRADKPEPSVKPVAPAHGHRPAVSPVGHRPAAPDADAARTLPVKGDPVIQPRVTPELGQTMAAVPIRDAAQIRVAEAEVSLDWKVGDIILDLYEVRPIREGAGQLYAEGGMGRVYRVHHKGWNIDLAAKVPLENRFQTEAQKENFTRECEAWVNLGLHPHAVSCQYVRRLGPVPMVFADFMEGGNLKEWIENRRLYEGGHEEALKRILDIAIQFAWGLHYAHEKGLIHQDVKPANVMMTPDGTAKVSDFGLARARAAAGETIQAQRPGMSMRVQGGGMMTREYASPEQVNGETLTRRTDIWSWAVSVYEMFVGELTWQSGLVVPELLQAYLQESAEETRIPRMPSLLAELLRQCLRENPEERPHDFGQIAGMLKEIYQAVGSETYGRSEPQPGELLADGLNNRALSFIDLGKPNEAERCFDRALEVDGQHLAATYNSGLMRWRAGRCFAENVLPNIRDLSDVHPNDGEVECALAWLQMESGRHTDAVANLEKAASLVRDSEIRAALEQQRHLPRPTSDQPMRVFRGHVGCVYAVASSPDSLHILSGGADKTLRLWEVATGRCVRIFEGHTKDVWSVAFSPDGRYVLSGSGDKTLRLWDAADGRCVRTFEGHAGGRVTCVALSPDGRFVLSGGAEIRLWDTATGACLRTSEAQQCGEVAFTPDGRLALSGHGSSQLLLWEMATGRRLRSLDERSDEVCSLALSTDGCLALSGGLLENSTCFRLWDTTTGQCLRTFGSEGHAGPAIAVAFSANGHFALSGGPFQVPWLWDVMTGQHLRRLMGMGNTMGPGAFSVAFSANNRFAVSGDGDGMIGLWDISFATERRYKSPWLYSKPVSEAEVVGRQREFEIHLRRAKECLDADRIAQALEFVQHASAVPGFERNPQCLEVKACASAGARIGRFVGAWQKGITLECRKTTINAVAFSPDGSLAFTGSDHDSAVKLWDVATGCCRRAFGGHTDGVNTISLSPDGRFVLSGSGMPGSEAKDATLKMWDTVTGQCLRTFEGHTAGVRSVDLSVDRRFALSGSHDMTLKMWDTVTGQCLRTFEGHTSSVNAVCLSAGGRFALSGSSDETLKLWDTAAGRCLSSFEGHAGSVNAIAVSPDGHSVLSGSGGWPWQDCRGEYALRLWDIATGKCRRVFKGHEDMILSVAYSLDGRFALSGSEDRTLRLWDIATGQCIRVLTGHRYDVRSVALSRDSRFAISGGLFDAVRLWEIDWEYEAPELQDWDEGARPYLTNFLTVHTPYGSTDPDHAEFLVRRGRPVWSHEDWLGLIRTLQCAGYGWLRPEGVRRELEKMAADWQGPPPLPWEK